MNFELPPLPYESSALEPFISRKTLEFHHGKHHKTYVEKLNQLIKGTEFENDSLENIILATKDSHKKIYNNAAQHWNHSFFWHCLSGEGKEISKTLENTLSRNFGSLENFKAKFGDCAKDLFGSGWTWLVKTRRGDLEIRNKPNARNPLNDYETPLLTLDVWEHAYYLDYQNERPKFIDAFWQVVNWEFVEANLEDSTGPRVSNGRHRQPHLRI